MLDEKAPFTEGHTERSRCRNKDFPKDILKERHIYTKDEVD